MDVKLTDGGGRVKKLGVKLMDHGDGTYSAQYYFNTPAAKLDVSVTLDGAHVAASPYVIKGWTQGGGQLCNPRP